MDDTMNKASGNYGAAKDAAKDTANRLADKASDMIDRASDRASDAYDEVSVRAREAGDAVRDYANQAADVLDDSIQNRPMTTLLGAIAFGFVLGALWKR
jgi:ElaB/YqjD/DUF883 family membrane-anchored ribosome-binding protein